MAFPPGPFCTTMTEGLSDDPGRIWPPPEAGITRGWTIRASVGEFVGAIVKPTKEIFEVFKEQCIFNIYADKQLYWTAKDV